MFFNFFFIISHQAVTGVSPTIVPLAMSFASVNSALTYRDGGKQTSLDYDQLVNILYEGQKTTFLALFGSHSVQRGSRRRRGDFLRVGYY